MAEEEEKKLKQNMSLDDFEKLTKDEKERYKREGDEITRKNQEGYKKAKEKPFKRGGMADLTGDGKITRADVLKGRGVFKRGGKVKKMNCGGMAIVDRNYLKGR